MTPDDELGVAWWNGLTERERAKWSAIAGNTGRPKDAWEAFKRGSVDQTPPVDQTRRHLLTIAAGGAVAAAIPTATLMAAPAVDPIFAAIERHKRAADAWDAAVEVWAKFPDGPGPMSMERRIERERISDAWSDARDALDDAGVSLINTSPTTHHGIARALNYIREQTVQENGVYMPNDLTLEGSDYPEIIGWIDAFLDTIAAAAADLGKAVLS
jgi:hypothetical protein